MQSKASHQALKLALFYAIVAGAWILLSDHFLRILVHDPDARTQISIYKGLVFVLVTGGLLYFAMRRLSGGWAREAEQRRQAEEASRRSQERYVLIERAVNDGLWDWNVLTGEDYFSPRWKEIIGYREDEFPNQRSAFLRQIHPEDLALVKEATRRHFEQGERYAIEFRLRHKDGGYRWVFSRGVAQRDAAGRPVRMTGAITDITERKRSEAAMRETEERYQALFDRSLDCVFLADFDGKFLDANQASLDLLGYQREDILKLTFASLLSEDQLPLAFQTVEEIKTTGRQQHPTEYRLRGKDGREVFVETQSSLIQRDGKPYAFQGIVRDLTERKRAERRILEATHYAQTLLAASPIGIITYRADGQTVSANEAAARLVGTTVEGVMKQNFRELESWKKSSLLERAERALATGKEQLFENHTVSSYGIHSWLSIRFVPFQYEGNPHLLLLAQDITERKRAEEQMHLQFSALTAAANAIVITDGQGKIEWVNPAFTKLTGYSAEEAIGGNLRMLKSGQHPPGFYANLWATIITGNVWHGELINKRKDGQVYTEEMTITPVRGADGEIAHFVAIKQDVTERRQLQHRLQQAQKMEAIGTLAGGIAHDFNNILAAMFGYGYPAPAGHAGKSGGAGKHRGNPQGRQPGQGSRAADFDLQPPA